MVNWTIVIPAYNEEKRIEETILRAKAQNTWHNYNIIVVDNWSNDKTKDIAYKAWAEIVEEKTKWVKFARLRWIEAARDLYNSRIIMQLDADSHIWPNWVEEHLNQFEDENVWIVWWSIKWTNRSVSTAAFIHTLDFFRGRVLSITELKIKDYFEKRKFWIEKWVIPIPWTNMSYLSELWSCSTTVLWWTSSLWEDYFKATRIYQNHILNNPNWEVRLIDNKNILVNTPSRWDQDFINFIISKYKYKKSNTCEAIKRWKLNDESCQMTDSR